MFYQMQKERMFYCLDKTDQFGIPIDLQLYGRESGSAYRQLSIVFRPCNPRQRTNENMDSENCLINDVTDKEYLAAMLKNSKEYLGERPQIDLLVNQEEFQPQSYGEKSIKKVSKIFTQYFSHTSPSWASMIVGINRIEDESSLFNVGQQKLHEYLSLQMGTNQESSWIHYPEKYKFFSIDTQINPDIL